MARKRSKQSEAPPSNVAETSSRAREVIGLAMLLMALALCFALFSFDHEDVGGEKNLVGPVGAGIASAVLQAVGHVGYLAGLAAVALASVVLFGRLRLPSLASVLAGVAILIGSTVLAQLSDGEAMRVAEAVENGADEPSYTPGGLLGLAVSGLLLRQAGPAGATLTAVGLVMIGVVVTLRLSLRSAVNSAYGWTRSGLREVWLGYRIRRDARRAAQQRQRELLDAAKEEEAEAERKTRMQAEAIQRAFDERARVAVLEATARAEEEALAKIETRRTKAGPKRPWTTTTPTPTAPLPAAGGEAIEVGVPGPAADPELIIAASMAVDEFETSSEVILEDAADVVERLDRECAPTVQSGQMASSPLNPVEDDFGADGAEDGWAASTSQAPAESPASPLLNGDHGSDVPFDALASSQASTPEAASPADSGPRRADSGAPEDVDDDLIIHERKEVGTDFRDERAAAVVARTPEKEYVLPPINLLDYEGDGPAPIDQVALKERATRLEEKLRTYGVEGRVMAIRPGPVVTTYEYQPAPGVKVAKIANLADDIAMSMEAVRVRIVAPIPGRGVVGIELPNDKRENVYLKEIIAHEAFKHSKSLLTLALGKDAEGEPQVRDLRKMPHLMIAGTTGSGKSVSINTMVLSMLYKATPDEVKFIMVDPKMLELSLYNEIPHLLLPVVTDPKKASLALAWTVDEMERRYRLLSDAKVRDIQGFNRKLEKLRKQREKDVTRRPKEADAEEGPEVLVAGDSGVDLDAATPTGQRMADPWGSEDLPAPMPFIVVLIDEFADLMMAAPRDVEASVQRLAQKARAAGIHVLLATQRPSTDVITGVIKNNFPSRLAFRVASRHDSATVLNNPGAENLLGMGDSLFLSVASPNPVRVHGAFVSEDEVERVVEFWKKQARPAYDPTILQPKDADGEGGFDEDDVDELYDQAVRFVTETRKASISAVQRKLRVGYNRAARMIDMMEAQGIVGPAQGPKGEREILVSAMGPDGPDHV